MALVCQLRQPSIAVVVLEQAARNGDPSWPEPFAAIRSRRYGDTVVHWAGNEPA